MKVKKSRLVDLYEALGVDSARSTWDTAKLVQKTNKDDGITRFREPGQEIKDPELEAMYDDIVKAREAGESIEVEDDTPEEAKKDTAKADTGNGKPANKPAPKASKPAPKKDAPKPAAKKVGGGRQRYEGHGTWEAYKTHLAKNPKAVGDRGVIAETFKILKHAGSQKKPVTKEQILEILKEKFGDREHAKLTTTLNNNVPGRLKWMYGIHVWHSKGDDGVRTYWISGDGKTPQPKDQKEAPKAKPAPAPKKEPAKKPAAKPAPKKAPAKKPAKVGAGKK